MGPTHELNSVVFGAPNPWPDSQLLPGWQLFMEEYHAAMTALALRLLGYMARALGIDPDFFDQNFSTPTSTLRLLHYYPHTDYEHGEIGAGAHTDYGGLTILLQGTGGLQVRV